MNCRRVEKHLVALVESTLAREERESLEEHISQCDRCRSLADFFSGVMAEAGPAEHIGFSREFWPGLNRRIADYEKGRAGWLSRMPRLRPAAVVACLLLGSWAGIHLGSAYSERVSTPLDSDLLQAAVFDGVAPGSLAELLLVQTINGGTRP